MTKKETKQTKKKKSELSGDNYWRALCGRQSGCSEPCARTHSPTTFDHDCQIGIYGWRKKFLYILIVLIAALVVLNAALTLWILSVLNFSVVFNQKFN